MEILSYAPERRSAPAFAKPATAGVGRSVRRRQGFGGLSVTGEIRRSNELKRIQGCEAQATHSSTVRARGFLRRRIKKELFTLSFYFAISSLINRILISTFNRRLPIG